MPGPTIATLLTQVPPFIPDGAEVMISTLALPPGDPGSPAHRHSGPVFGYVLEGALEFQLAGEPSRVHRAGEAFWEPGGELIHLKAANALADAETRFVIVMLGKPGEPMLVPVSAEEIAAAESAR